MSFISKTVLTSKAAHMLNFCQPNKHVLLGVGKTLPWPVEGTPPSIDSSLFDVPELSFFVQTSLTTSLIHDDLGDVILQNGSRFTKTDTLNAQEVAFSNALNLLIEARIDHNLLPSLVNSYRSFGVYTNCTFFDPSSLNDSIIPVSAVQDKVLDTLIFFSPVFKQLNLLEQVNIIREFS